MNTKPRNLYIREAAAINLGETLKACGSIARYRVFPRTIRNGDRSTDFGFVLVTYDTKGRPAFA